MPVQYPAWGTPPPFSDPQVLLNLVLPGRPYPPPPLRSPLGAGACSGIMGNPLPNPKTAFLAPLTPPWPGVLEPNSPTATATSYPTDQRMGEGSGNLGREPETLKGEKLGGCLRKQGVGKIKQPNLSGCGGSNFNIRRRDICRPLTPPGCVGAPSPHDIYCRGAARRPKP